MQQASRSPPHSRGSHQSLPKHERPLGTEHDYSKFFSNHVPAALRVAVRVAVAVAVAVPMVRLTFLHQIQRWASLLNYISASKAWGKALASFELEDTAWREASRPASLSN